jgi:hypothetical protein
MSSVSMPRPPRAVQFKYFGVAVLVVVGSVWLRDWQGGRAQHVLPAAVSSGMSVSSHLGEQADQEIKDHPLVPTMKIAERMLSDLRHIADYSCVMTKREWVEDRMTPRQTIFMKVRHEPFSVYMRFLEPSNVRGQEVIYVEGRNDGNMLAHTTGLKHKLLGTVKLNPTGDLAMEGNRYPITMAGLLNLVERLDDVGHKDMHHGECVVQNGHSATEQGPCHWIDVAHPVRRPYFLYQSARIYIDDKLNLPVRFEAYDWPEQGDENPRLVEEYTYSKFSFDNGFTDRDFDPANPEYAFSRASSRSSHHTGRLSSAK